MSNLEVNVSGPLMKGSIFAQEVFQYAGDPYPNLGVIAFAGFLGALVALCVAVLITVLSTKRDKAAAITVLTASGVQSVAFILYAALQ